MSDARQAHSALASKPDHVPDVLVVDFDLFHDAALLKDPHARILDLLATAPPIFWTPRHGGAWIALAHQANFEAARNWEIFSNEIVPLERISAMAATMPKGSPHIPIALPIAVDPPAHTTYRQPLVGAFSPKAMNALRDEIRALARELIAGVAPHGRCEFMKDVAEPLPVGVFLKMFGLPLERQGEYRKLVKEHLESINLGSQDTMTKLIRVAAVMRDSFLERRDNPKDDLISALWRSKIDGRDVAIEDMENWGVVLFIAGLDTVMNGIGFAVRHLAEDAELQAALRASPNRIVDASEEMLRRYTFTVPPRVVKKDTVFMDVTMKAGERLMLLLAGANLDARRFPAPEAFDAAREDKAHIAFGAGPHRCLGSHLARVELRILYEELLTGLPPFRINRDRPPKFHGGHVIGLDNLDLVWDC